MTQERMAEMAGRIIGTIIAVIFFAVLFPWIGIGSINRLFDVSIAHTAWNYLYFWILLLLTGFRLNLRKDK